MFAFFPSLFILSRLFRPICLLVECKHTTFKANRKNYTFQCRHAVHQYSKRTLFYLLDYFVARCTRTLTFSFCSHRSFLCYSYLYTTERGHSILAFDHVQLYEIMYLLHRNETRAEYTVYCKHFLYFFKNLLIQFYELNTFSEVHQFSSSDMSSWPSWIELTNFSVLVLNLVQWIRTKEFKPTGMRTEPSVQ